MSRIVVPAADALVDVEVPVLDYGFVRLVDFLGGDLRIVQAARISYAKTAKDADLEGNRKLITYLIKNGHSSPLEQTILVFHLKLPIFVMRQLVRHRTARLNEMSARYTEMPDEFFVPDTETIRQQDTKNRQGRSDLGVTAIDPHDVVHAIARANEIRYALYQVLLEGGVARELARIVLPVSLYTQAYWQIDLHNLLHFLHLRLDAHAQEEIRVYAEQMLVCARAVAPMAVEAWEENVRFAKVLSRSEWAALEEGKNAHA